jgi:hypothetical protein
MGDIRVIYSYMDETNGGAQARADITDLVAQLTIKTTMEAQPGVLNMTAIGDGFEYILGSMVQVYTGDRSVFDGFIFSVTTTRAKTVQVVAYDVLRYLKGKDTYVFNGGVTASDIFKTVCKRLELETGTIDTATWKQRPDAYENAGGFDVIRDAIEDALAHEKVFYVLIPEGRKIHFRDITKLQTDIIIDEENGEIDYQHNANIDEEVYDQFKVLADDSKQWKTYRNDAHVRQWGMLQYSQKFGSPVRDKDLPRLLEKLAQIYDRPKQRLTLTCFGDWNVRAGAGVHVRFSSFRNFDNGQGYYVRECTHTVTNARHEMNVDLCAQNLI